MRRITLSLAVTLGFLLVTACGDNEREATEEAPAVQEPAEEMAPATPTGPLANFAGEWNGTSYMEGGDTVQYSMTATADTTGWMIDLPDRDPMPMRILSAAGDSVVSEIGPYESLFREGVMVTVRTVSRLQGDRMVGTVEAHYQGVGPDSIVRGRTEGTRGM